MIPSEEVSVSESIKEWKLSSTSVISFRGFDRHLMMVCLSDIFCIVEERAWCTVGLVTVPDIIVQFQLYSSLYLYFVLLRSEHAAQRGWLQCQIY